MKRPVQSITLYDGHGQNPKVLTAKDYYLLRDSGLLWELHPDAPLYWPDEEESPESVLDELTEETERLGLYDGLSVEERDYRVKLKDAITKAFELPVNKAYEHPNTTIARMLQAVLSVPHPDTARAEGFKECVAQLSKLSIKR